MPRRFLVGGLVLVGVGLAGAGAAATDDLAAVVNGVEIKRNRIEALYDTMADRKTVPLADVYDRLLEHAIREDLVQAEMEKTDLRDDPEVARRLAAIENQILRDIFLTRQAEKAVTDDMVRTQYEAVATPRDEVHARHILLADETAARAVLKRLQKGEDFAALAREVSRDPSAAEGGDLGYVTRDQMPAAFSDAAFGLEPGQIAKTPVHTAFGWHVIAVDDRRTSQPPPLDSVREEIRAVLLQHEAARYVDSLEAKADIERFDLTGEPRTAP